MRKSLTIKFEQLRQLWWDELGMVHASQLLLVVTVLALGIVTGGVTLRDAFVQEYGDAGLSLQNLNQSYYYTLRDADGNVINPNGNGYSAEYNDTVGGLADLDDFTNPGPSDGGTSPGIQNDGLVDGNALEGLFVNMPAIMEGGALDTSVDSISNLDSSIRIPATHEGDGLPAVNPVPPFNLPPENEGTP